MRLDAQSPHEWSSINQLVKEKVGCQGQVFVYRGLHQAIFETLLGLHLKFQHKRKVVAQLGFGDHLESAEMELARLGVRVKDSFDEDMAKEEKQTLAYLHDLDDALTSELYDHIETLKKVASTKMYRIHIAHHLFFQRKTFVKKLSDFDIIICSISPQYALVFTGEKIVLPTLTVGQLAWDSKADGQRILNLIESDRKAFQSEIISFETSLPDGVRPFFTTQPAKRIYDRAVVILPEHDGSAMQELLARHLKLELQNPGYENPIESASYCRWQNDVWYEQAKALGYSAEDMRGMLLIAGELLSKDFEEVFRECFQMLKSYV